MNAKVGESEKDSLFVLQTQEKIKKEVWGKGGRRREKWQSGKIQKVRADMKGRREMDEREGGGVEGHIQNDKGRLELITTFAVPQPQTRADRNTHVHDTMSVLVAL